MQAGLSFRLATCCFSPLACSATRVFHPTGRRLPSLIIRQRQPSAPLLFVTRKARQRFSHPVSVRQAVSLGRLMGAISADGEMVAFSESGEAVAGKAYSYVRSIRGASAVRLGEGRPWSISPDKKWVVVTTESIPPQLVLLPIGPDEPKRYPPINGDISYHVLGGREADNL